MGWSMSELYCGYCAPSIMECYNFIAINRVSLINIAQKYGSSPEISNYSGEISEMYGVKWMYIYRMLRIRIRIISEERSFLDLRWIYRYNESKSSCARGNF